MKKAEHLFSLNTFLGALSSKVVVDSPDVS